MRTWLIALMVTACALFAGGLAACSQKSSLYLQPGEKSAAPAPPKAPSAPSPTPPAAAPARR